MNENPIIPSVRTEGYLLNLKWVIVEQSIRKVYRRTIRYCLVAVLGVGFWLTSVLAVLLNYQLFGRIQIIALVIMLSFLVSPVINWLLREQRKLDLELESLLVQLSRLNRTRSILPVTEKKQFEDDFNKLFDTFASCATLFRLARVLTSWGQ